jgi:hypothetical protein
MSKSAVTRRAALLSAGAAVATSATGASGDEATAVDDATVILFERAPVKDYDAWFKVFNDFGPDLRAAGVLQSTVYRGIDDPNDVTVLHTFKTAEEAQAFLNGEALKNARAKAGVTVLPTTWMTHKVDAETF